MPTDDDRMREYLKRTTAELRRTQDRLRELTERGQEPIAVVGMGCRLPGGIESPDQLWDLVRDGGDAISAFPADRHWDLDALFGTGQGRDGRCYVREGGFLRGAGEFDAAFFGISPREALVMDPQQRVLLEVAWETVESAGINPNLLRDTRTGVFVGSTGNDYEMVWKSSSEYSPHGITGNSSSVLSGRISYCFGLTGPSITVDTACSSSLVAIHQATAALRGGECELALAGGVTVMSTSDTFSEFCGQGVTSESARCRSFAEAADGAIWAEGAGLLLLERLSEARRNGHPVLALLRGSAVNSDGTSNGLSAPSGSAQRAVITAALAEAGLSTQDIDAVDAHGTGTTLGDPIEADALIATYGRDRAPELPLWLGSLKSNIGHTQGAAGVAGAIKLILAMRQGVLPKTLHVDAPSSKVDWSAGGVRLLTEARDWPETGRPRRAAVSSFGISGTNAHLLLEAPPAAAVPDDHDAPPEPGALPLIPWVLSGRTEAALPGQAARLLAAVSGDESPAPADVAGALVGDRVTFRHRAVVFGAGTEALIANLRGLADGTGGAAIVDVPAPGPLAVLCTGQGAQRPGMGARAAECYPVYAAALDEICAELDPQLPQPLREVMHAPPGSAESELLARTEFAQPALFACEVALLRLLRSWGVVPELLAGHSIGEIAAAHVAGVWSLADACRMVAARGRLMQALPSGGAMLTVRATESEIVPELVAVADRVSLAAVNGPEAVVLSGDADALAELEREWSARGRGTWWLRVSHAFHSPLMEPMLAEFGEVLRGLTFHPPTIPIVSTLTGRRADTELSTPDYWVEHARNPVRFTDALATLRELGAGTLLEVGPAAVLSAMAAQDPDNPVAVPAVRADSDEAESILRAVGRLHTRGVAVDWSAVLAPLRPRPVPLPTYAFQREQYWIAPDPRSGDVETAGLRPAGHPLLGAALALADDGGLVLTGRISLRSQPWLAGHAAMDTVILPGTAFIELALCAGGHVGCDTVEELTLQSLLAVPDTGAVDLQVRLGPPDDFGSRSLRVFSRPADAETGAWRSHATGSLAVSTAAAGDGLVDWPPAGARSLPVDGCYEDPEITLAYRYEGAFRGVRAVWLRGEDADTELFAEVALPTDHAADAERYGLHPALLDAALQTVGLGPFLDPINQGSGSMPFSWSGLSLHASGAGLVRVRVSGTGADGHVRLDLADETGAPVATVANLTWRPVPRDAAEFARPDTTNSLYGLDWIPAAAAPSTSDTEGWAVLGEPGGAVAGTAFVTPADLAGAVDDGNPLPPVVLYPVPAALGGSVLKRARSALDQVTETLQGWLAEERFTGTPLVVLTRAAVAADATEPVDLSAAAVCGVVRSAQAENPGRVLLLDLDDSATPADVRSAVATALAAGEPQAALREGTTLVPRLRPVANDGLLTVPPGTEAWRLDTTEPGTLDSLVLLPCPEALAPLAPGDVRVAVRAAGVNFRDVLVALGMYPGAAVLGAEAAGVILEVGAEVTGLRQGDAVLGVFTGAMGTHAVTDHRLVALIPADWTFEFAASVPIAYLTAYYGLVDLAGLGRGESVLIHSGAGGVGIAAIQLARHLGAEVFATASEGKHELLRALGVPDDHIASSRTVEFEQRFRDVTGGRGVDVVLNSLTGEFLEGSLRLLAPGGRFLEIGKADVRDPEAVGAAHPGVRYHAYDLVVSAGEDRIARMLPELFGMFERGALTAPPRRAWDIRRGDRALRHVSQARHVGKVVLTVPRDPDPDGTVLITGGTGWLGRLLATHLAGRGQRHLMLLSRSGADAPGAAQLVTELADLGTQVTVVRADVAERDDVRRALAQVPTDHPLTAVVHVAGVLADGVIGSLTTAGFDRVLRPKLDGAWHLHELTRELDLAAFVCFSSAAGIFGAAGQGAYAAANSFVDALMHQRRAEGLPGTALAWGLWAPGDDEADSGMAGGLSAADWARMGRTGVVGLSATHGLALWDAAAESDRTLLAPIGLDLATVSRLGSDAPALLRDVVRAPARRATSARQAGAAAGESPEALLRRLDGLPAAQRQRALLGLVRGHLAAVLGYASGEDVPIDTPFMELGFDSLTSVELRNRLTAATGLRLAATLVFDHPTTIALAEHLDAGLGTPAPALAPALAELTALERSVSTMDADDELRATLHTRLRALLSTVETERAGGPAADLSEASADELFAFVDREFGDA